MPAASDPRSDQDSPRTSSRLLFRTAIFTLPFTLALTISIVMATNYLTSGRWTYHEWTYPLDDAYIHLAMARNWVIGAGYGTIPNVTASSSSSPLWTLLISCGFLLRLGSAGPLVLNALFFALLIGIFSEATRVHASFARIGVRIVGSHAGAAAVSILFLALLPLHPLLVSGMEHLAHLTACVFLFRAMIDRHQVRTLFLLSAMGMALRYETIFLAFAMSLLFLRRRELPRALAVMGGAMATLGVVAIFLVSKGLPPIPISILLKRQTLDLSLVPNALQKGIAAPHLLGLLVLFLLVVLSADAKGARSTEISGKDGALVFGGTLVAHLLFAQVGWLYRYDAYLVGLGLYVALRTPELTLGRLAQIGMPLLFLGLSVRAIFASATTVIASRNISDQEGTLVDLVHYARAAEGPLGIAVTDVGTIAYEEGGRIVDLMGLATPNVARTKGLRLNQALTEDEVVMLTEGLSLAIINDTWIPRKPKHWRKVATFHIANNRVCASPDTVVYAIDPKNEAKMGEVVLAFVREKRARRGVTFELPEPPAGSTL